MLPGASRRFAMDLFLPPLVGFCQIGDSVIFLDARADRYWMLPAAMSEALVRRCKGIEPGEDEAALLVELVRMGLLKESAGAHLAPCVIPKALTSRLDPHPRSRASSTIVAGLCVAAASYRLRMHGLYGELMRLQSLRERRSDRHLRIDRHAQAFARLRLLVSPIGRCLPLSLALARRCASEDAQLIFGVQLNPFAAHAWVQRDTEVLNDEIHVVQAFTPVLAI